MTGLTVREQQVLVAISQGLTEPEIATQFDIRLNTVRSHTKNVRLKLGARRNHEAVAIGFQTGTLR